MKQLVRTVFFFQGDGLLKHYVRTQCLFQFSENFSCFETKILVNTVKFGFSLLSDRCVTAVQGPVPFQIGSAVGLKYVPDIFNVFWVVILPGQRAGPLE